MIGRNLESIQRPVLSIRWKVIPEYPTFLKIAFSVILFDSFL
jgi:hypothetical protein